jgi:hypothetical protein
MLERKAHLDRARGGMRGVHCAERRQSHTVATTSPSVVTPAIGSRHTLRDGWIIASRASAATVALPIRRRASARCEPARARRSLSLRYGRSQFASFARPDARLPWPGLISRRMTFADSFQLQLTSYQHRFNLMRPQLREIGASQRN